MFTRVGVVDATDVGGDGHRGARGTGEFDPAASVVWPGTVRPSRPRGVHRAGRPRRRRSGCRSHVQADVQERWSTVALSRVAAMPTSSRAERSLSTVGRGDAFGRCTAADDEAEPMSFAFHAEHDLTEAAKPAGAVLRASGRRCFPRGRR